MEEVKKIEQQAMSHIHLRWVGAPLFLMGLVWFILAFQQAVAAGVWFPVMIGFASSMMGLTCFGLNHDTAIQMALQIRSQQPEYVFNNPLQREVSEELNRDYANALTLSGHPTLGKILPVITLMVHGLMMYVLFLK